MSLEANKTFLFGKGEVDGSGDVTLESRNSKGIASMVHNGAGDYSIFLQDVYVKLMGLNIVTQFASGVPANAGYFIISESVSSPSGKEINVGLVDAAGSLVDPDNGAQLLIEVILSNSSAP
jgi:hypothetical protein